MADSMFFGMIDQYSLTIQPRKIGKHVQNHPRPLIFVFQVWRVNQNLLAKLLCQLHVLKKYGRLVASVLVQSDFADSQYISGF